MVFDGQPPLVAVVREHPCLPYGVAEGAHHSIFCQENVTGRVRAKSITDQPQAKLSAATGHRNSGLLAFFIKRGYHQHRRCDST